MAAPLLTLQNIALTFGGTPLFEDATLSVSEADRICIVGRNGSGKSTLMKIAAGLVEPDRGTRFFQPGITLRYLPQEPDFGEHKTVLSYVESGLGPSDDPYQARFLLWRTRANRATKRPQPCRAEKRGERRWPRRSRQIRTCFSSTSRRTTSTSR